MTDLEVAREEFIFNLPDNEKAIADDGYVDYTKFIFPEIFPRGDPIRRVLKMIMARHETFNGRLCSFAVLNTPFRHELEFHPPCFFAVLKVIQMMMLFGGEPLYSVV